MRRRYQAPTPKKEGRSWKIRYRDLDGKQHTKCVAPIQGTTLAEARRLAAEFLKAFNDAKPSTRFRGRTLETVFDHWERVEREFMRKSTALRYDWLRSHLRQGNLLDAPLGCLGRADVAAFLADRGRKLNPRTLRLLRALLSGMFSRAVDWGWLDVNPAAGRFRGLPKVQPADRRSLSPQVVAGYAEVAGHPLKAAILLGALAGLRRGEIEALHWEDVEATRVHVRRGAFRGEIGPPKTNRSRRTVPIGPQLRTALEEWRAASGDPSEGLVFPGRRRGRPMHLDNRLRYRFGSKLRWHDLRHSYATWGREAGLKAETMRDLLGHESIALTLGLYSHAQDQDSAARIEGHFAGGAVTPGPVTPAAKALIQ